MSGASSSPPTVLIMESAPVRRAVFLGLLPPKRFDISFPREDEDWGAALQERCPDVVLVWQEDPSQLAQTCARLRAQAHGSHVAIVAVGRGDGSLTDTIVHGAGADALLILPADPAEVENTIYLAIQSRSEKPEKVRALDENSVSEPVLRAPTITEPKAPEVKRAEAPSWEDFVRRVDELYARMYSMTHYEALGIKPNAPVHVINEAFYDRAIDFHPDRYTQLEDRALAGKIYEIFKRISQAYEVLRDMSPRADYDALLRRGKIEHATPPQRPQIRKLVEMAERALDEGYPDRARGQLILALRDEPGSKYVRNLLAEAESRIAGNGDEGAN